MLVIENARNSSFQVGDTSAQTWDSFVGIFGGSIVLVSPFPLGSNGMWLGFFLNSMMQTHFGISNCHWNKKVGTSSYEEESVQKGEDK